MIRFALAVLIALGSFLTVYAQDDFEKVQVLDHPRYTLLEKLVLDIDLNFLPLDGYVKPVFIEAAVSYQWSDFVAFEPVRIGYSLYNHDTGLRKSIEARLRQTAPTFSLDESPLANMRFMAGSNVYFNLLYSKSNFFNKAVAYHYWQVGGGVIYYDMDNKKQIGADLAMRVRFFVSEKMTFNIRGGHSIGFNSDAPSNITHIGLGLGYAF